MGAKARLLARLGQPLRNRRRRRAVAYRVPELAGMTALEDETFVRVLRHAMGRVGARAVHLEQLVGLPLASLAECLEEETRLILSMNGTMR